MLCDNGDSEAAAAGQWQQHCYIHSMTTKMATYIAFSQLCAFTFTFTLARFNRKICLECKRAHVRLFACKIVSGAVQIDGDTHPCSFFAFSLSLLQS